jgi:hypothetical protein
MTFFAPFTAGQAEQMHFLQQAWPEYGHSLQVTAAFSGGMGWKSVRGVDYLVRYHSEDGKKKFTSYGKRSPETEEKLRAWEDTTGRARRIVKEKKDEVALACRLAKAHGAARLHGRLAEMLERCWYLDVDKRLSLFGGTALMAYEGAASALMPLDLIKDDRLHFVSCVEDDELGLEEIVDVVCDVDHAGCESVREGDRISIVTAAGAPRAEIYLPRFFHRLAETDRQAETFEEALTMLRWKGLAVARDGRPVALTALHPAAYAVLAAAMGNDLWDARAEAAFEIRETVDPDGPELEIPGRAWMRGP